MKTVPGFLCALLAAAALAQPPPPGQPHYRPGPGGPPPPPGARWGPQNNKLSPYGSGAYQQYPPPPPPPPPAAAQRVADEEEEWEPPGKELAAAAVVPEDSQFDLALFDQAYFFAELKKMYKRKMLPLELASRYAHFSQSPPLGPADFEAKPMVLLLGQYSVGKTSFIRSLLGRDFPGQRIGPEPTTDRFVAVMHGDADRSIPGNALAMRADRPFAGLQSFGNSFLEKLQGAEVEDCAILENVTLVDTPGILSGEKQRIGREYDFQAVMRWFADRADMIILMFDAHKLDISDELKNTIDALRPHHAKLKVVLNKADTISPQHLLRVYGALMWQLGRVVASPEVVRVHLGSFTWDPPSAYGRRPSRGPLGPLLDRERDDLVNELACLPRNAVLRKINDLSKRGRFLKVHCYIIHYLRKQMPFIFGKDEKRRKLIHNLGNEFHAAASRYGLSIGDFPNLEEFKIALAQIQDISAFPKLDKSLLADMDKMFAVDVPRLLDKAAARVTPPTSAPLPHASSSAPQPSY